ncbi:MAG TPA: N-acetylglucosamine-6-phosphate deacetylase [Planctomycetota bacterium]|nr:N-acetylglucosamine-6-phosphate deacetylase [Planctomycetota bacterium]
MAPRKTVLTRVLMTSGSEPVDLHLADGRIEAIRPHGSPLPEGAVRVDGGGLTAVPGFIDLHVHGGKGADFMDATEDAFRTSAEYHAAGGTTSYLPSTATESPEAILACIDMAARCRDQNIGGVEILGVHVEGPYMAPKKHGCHDPGFVREPSREENRAFLDRANIIRRITLAPEVPGVQEFIREAARAGILLSGGHSDATLEETRRAIGNGMTLITHLYCAMSTIVRDGPYRIPGMLETTLLDDRLATELIADLKHVSADLMLLAMKAKAERTVCFVTDAMRGAGMPDGTYHFGSARGTPAVVERGVARNLQNTGFASSTVRMVDLVRNAVEVMGLSLEAAVRRASLIPAAIARVDDRKGSLDPGKDADLVLLETRPRLEVRKTIVRGEIVHAV